LHLQPRTQQIKKRANKKYERERNDIKGGAAQKCEVLGVRVSLYREIWDHIIRDLCD